MQYPVLYFFNILDKQPLFIVICEVIFKFKQFEVSHGISSMKVGTDAVLLGAWAKIAHSQTILEVGCGCGVISLMLAQRNENTLIYAIDIHDASVTETNINFRNSLWNRRLKAHLISIQEYKPTVIFDHIVSNPPFFTNSFPAPNRVRHHARHTETLLPVDFFKACRNLLSPGGKISLILPYHDFENWQHQARENAFYPSRVTQVFSYPDKIAERVLVEFDSQTKSPQTDSFNIRNGKGMAYSDAYLNLTQAFYL